jgi:transcriptional repressor NrdR
MDSRVTDEGLAIRRRRVCDKCGFRFSTIEEVEILNLTVVKRDGRREPYSREKLENGLRKAFEKRPLTGQTLKRLIGQIERDVQLRGRSEITSQQIGEIVMKRLQRIDQVAYIRFASVYRQFQDVESFKRELNRLTSTRRPATPRTRRRKKSA